MLSIPFRRTHPVSLSEALKKYITEQYDQHPDMFKDDLAAIDRLRSEAVSIREPHTSGIAKISQYAGQLVWLSGKFPADIGVEFKWTTSLGYNASSSGITDGSVRFELANVLFNLAALYSQLAYSLNRSTVEGLKAASDYLCRAAGVFQWMKEDLIPTLEATVPEDMDPLTLDCLQHLMLAQAQECSWLVAVKNNYKDSTIARLAAKVSDYYDCAADSGTKTESVETEWLHHMSIKHHHFAAAAQLRAACDCLERRKYGEEVARLRDSIACAVEGLKESQWVSRAVVGDLNKLKEKAAQDLQRAEKDNDMIYLQIVPPKSELKKLDRANLAVPKKPVEIADPTTSLGDKGSLGQPLFTRLVPYSVHVAASLYAEKRDRLVNAHILDELEVLNNRMRDFLASLNLPGSLEALEKPLGLPASIKQHADEIRQQGGVHKLRRSYREVEKLRADDAAIYQEGVSFLQVEAAEDDDAREKYGTDRWRRPSGDVAVPKLYQQVGEIDSYIKSATASDGLIKEKIRHCESALKVMEGTTLDLENYVPNSRKTVMSPKVHTEASKLRAILDDLERMEGRRRRKAQAVREKAQRDDVNPALLQETARLERDFPMQRIEAAQFEHLFERRLEDYDEDRLMVKDDRDEQEKLLAKLKKADKEFSTVRRGDVSATKDREQALQKLEDAYRSYNEILRNLDNARKFYNDLSRLVGIFRDECREFRHSRRLEAGQVESDLSNAMSDLNLQKQTSLQEQKEREAMRARYNTRSSANNGQATAKVPGPSTGLSDLQSAQEQMPAPKPTRAPVPPPAPVAAVWNPEMGIKFAGAPAEPPSGQAPQGGNVHNPAYPSTRSGRWSPGRGLRFN